MARVLVCTTILFLGGSVLAGEPEDKGNLTTRNQALYPRLKMETSLGSREPMARRRLSAGMTLRVRKLAT